MKILHTSDWHLGRSLYGKKRYEEFETFLAWLIETIKQENIDTLLVAGDVFDSGTPSNRAQNLYYRFLGKVASTSCRHIVVIAGNHDSPSFLNAPKELLMALNVYVVGSITEDLSDEVIVLGNIDNEAEAIVCAVPYLRDRDIRIAEAGESIDDKNTKLIEGISKHYAEVCQIAEEKRVELNKANLPIIAMGHLFTAGGQTIDGDGVRELYVGSLNQVHVDNFPTSINYLALGHLHIPQLVSKRSHILYCGSPLPMGFGEANQEKKVIIIEFDEKNSVIQELTVPTFQKLVRIAGKLEDIIAKIEELKEQDSSAWLEIEYNGLDIIPNLREIITEALIDSQLEVRRIKNKQLSESVAMAIADNETLDDLTPKEVFKRCLDANEISDADRIELAEAYNEILRQMQEEDSHAE